MAGDRVGAIRIERFGEAEVLEWGQIELAPPGPGAVRVRHTAIGVNYSDINVRRGTFYSSSQGRFPIVPGNEAAGIVEALGPGVADCRVGDRVAYAGMDGPFYMATGAYAQARNVPAARLIHLPGSVDDALAASILVKGLTASGIIRNIHAPAAGDTVLVHAAASGVALLLVQFCKRLGATVIGTAGSEQKGELARAAGCDHVVVYRDVDFVEAVRAIAPKGVAAVYDGVGKDTFMRSLDCMGRFATLVNYGNASGRVPPLDVVTLADKGSLKVARPGLHDFTADMGLVRAAAFELFDLAQGGGFVWPQPTRMALADAQKAHQAVETRRQVGPIVLVPGPA